MIMNKRILCVSSTDWESPGELQVVTEALSGSNNIVWINPFGGISSNLLPRIDRLTETLTIYNPGINLLPLPFLGRLNRSRLLIHTKLYLFERDFEPDVIIIDSPVLHNFAKAYRKTGTRALYYAPAAAGISLPRPEKQKAEEAVDYTYKAGKIPEDINEDQYMVLINKQVNEISKLLEPNLQ